MPRLLGDCANVRAELARLAAQGVQRVACTGPLLHASRPAGTSGRGPTLTPFPKWCGVQKWAYTISEVCGVNSGTVSS